MPADASPRRRALEPISLTVDDCRNPAAITKQTAGETGVDVVFEQKREQMQKAAGEGDFILAGQIQEDVERLEDLHRRIQEAARQNNFIQAGRLQARFRAMTRVNPTFTCTRRTQYTIPAVASPRRRAMELVALTVLFSLALGRIANETARVDDPISRALETFRAASSSRRRRFTVDILSISSVYNLDLLAAQQSTFATHVSVRNFFNATELDDADPDCDIQLTWDKVQEVSDFCRRKKLPLNAAYATPEWLKKKANPAGWLCAQARPLAGLLKVYRYYTEMREALPDFLIVMDDDTYIEMGQFEENFGEMNSSDAIYYAGCLIRFRIGPTPEEANFTAPMGGAGSFMSRGTLENLFRPMNCPSFGAAAGGDNAPQYSSKEICDRLDEDKVKERQYFRNGQNLVRLMYAYSSTEKYRDVSSWTTGYCMHSDWALGYFANYYYASRHVAPATNEKKAWMDKVPHLRIEAYKGSEIYRKATGVCSRDCLQSGLEGTDICHRATPEWMRSEMERAKRRLPGWCGTCTWDDKTTCGARLDSVASKYRMKRFDAQREMMEKDPQCSLYGGFGKHKKG